MNSLVLGDYKVVLKGPVLKYDELCKIVIHRTKFCCRNLCTLEKTTSISPKKALVPMLTSSLFDNAVTIFKPLLIVVVELPLKIANSTLFAYLKQFGASSFDFYLVKKFK